MTEWTSLELLPERLAYWSWRTNFVITFRATIGLSYLSTIVNAPDYESQPHWPTIVVILRPSTQCP